MAPPSLSTPALPRPLDDHQPRILSTSLEQNEPSGGELSGPATLMNISGTALPPRRLRREADSASATYTINPRYSRALCSQVRLLARSICNPQINARSCSRPFTDTCRAASNSSRPTRSERRPKQARPGPCLGSHSVRGCPFSV